MNYVFVSDPDGEISYISEPMTREKAEALRAKLQAQAEVLAPKLEELRDMTYEDLVATIKDASPADFTEVEALLLIDHAYNNSVYILPLGVVHPTVHYLAHPLPKELAL